MYTFKSPTAKAKAKAINVFLVKTDTSTHGHKIKLFAYICIQYTLCVPCPTREFRFWHRIARNEPNDNRIHDTPSYHIEFFFWKFCFCQFEISFFLCFCLSISSKFFVFILDVFFLVCTFWIVKMFTWIQRFSRKKEKKTTLDFDSVYFSKWSKYLFWRYNFRFRP